MVALISWALERWQSPVDCTALEMRRSGNTTEGSNPSLSARITMLKLELLLILVRLRAAAFNQGLYEQGHREVIISLSS